MKKQVSEKRLIAKLWRLFNKKERHECKFSLKSKLTVFGFPSEVEKYRARGGRFGDFLPVNLNIYRCKCGQEKRVYRDIWNKKHKEVVYEQI